MSRPRQGRRGPVVVKCVRLRCDSSTWSFKLIWLPYGFIAGKSRQSSPNLFFQINLILSLWLSQWSTVCLNLANILSFLPELHKPSINSSTSKQKWETFAALWLPERSFYHTAHLLKLTPPAVALQASPFKQPSYTNQRNTASTHTHRVTDTQTHILPQLCR